jgi:MFS family permease
MTLRAYGIIVAAFFTVFIAYAIRYGYGLLLPRMLPALGITKTQAGVIYAAYFVAYTLFSPLLGFLSDRMDVRRILTAFTALLALGAFLMAYAVTVGQAALFFTLAGIGHAACWAPVVALVQRWVADRNRGSALAVATMGSGVGIAVWSLVLPAIVGRFSWRAGWISMGAFGLCVAGVNWLLVDNPPPSAGERLAIQERQIPLRTQGRMYLRLLQERHLWLIGLSYLLVGFTVLVPYTFLTAYATEELRMPFSAGARFITLMAVAGMVGKLGLGILSDRWGRLQVMILCGLLMGLGCWGIANIGLIPAKFFFVALFGFGFGAVWPVYAAAAPDFFAKSATGSVIGLWTVFLGLGSILSPVVCGWSIDASGTYQWAFDIGLISALFSALLLVPLFRSARSAVQ